MGTKDTKTDDFYNVHILERKARITDREQGEE